MLFFNVYLFLNSIYSLGLDSLKVDSIVSQLPVPDEISPEQKVVKQELKPKNTTLTTNKVITKQEEITPLVQEPVELEPPRCQIIRIRKEIRSLSSIELNQFHQGINQLKRNGKLDNMCQVHLNNVIHSHGTPYFLPWHREFINQLEDELIRINPQLTLPYWDWTIGFNAPHRSQIFTNNFFGGNGNNRTGGCITNSRHYGHWRNRVGDSGCLKRAFDNGNSISTFYSKPLINDIIRRSQGYNDFRENIEGSTHGLPHNLIGGDMKTMHSCNDPLFYLHHSYIDKIWYDWQSRSARNIRDFGGPNANANNQLRGLGKRVRETLDVENDYCYSYYPTRLPNQSLQRRELLDTIDSKELTLDSIAENIREKVINKALKVERPKPLSSEWLRMNNLDESTYRRNYLKDMQLFDQLYDVVDDIKEQV